MARKASKSPILQKLTGPLAARYGALPKIPLPAANELQRSFNTDVAHVLKGSDLYRRATLPMFPFEGALTQMKPDTFVSWSQKYFVGFKTKTDKDGNPITELRDMTESVAKLCLSSYEFIAQVPMIHRIYPSPVPIITEQGILTLCTPGYDPATGTYVFEGTIQPQPADPARPPITGPVGSENYFDDSVTPAEAFWHLYDLHAGFPMSDWSDWITPAEGDPLWRLDDQGQVRKYRMSRSLSVQIGAMLALFAANCVPKEASRMGFVYNANQQRSGKTLLIKIATAPVYGAFKAQSWREDEESMVKILDSEILAASPYICFDNVRGLIQSTKLEALFTSPMWTGRILGKSEMFTAENNTTIFISGNNVNAGTDIQHRCLYSDLHVEEADIQSRSIDGPIIDDVWLNAPANRRAILSALWSIVRHWDHAGRPLAQGRTRQGFDTWGKIIGGMVEFAWFGDMLERPVMENAGDSEGEDILNLVKLLHGKHSHDFTYQELVHTCWDHGLFSWNLQGREEMRPLRPEQGAPAILTLNLESKCQSRMGLLFKRHCSEKGQIFTFRDDQGHLTKVKFFSKGAGRHKRFFVNLIN